MIEVTFIFFYCKLFEVLLHCFEIFPGKKLYFLVTKSVSYLDGVNFPVSKNQIKIFYAI